MPELPEVETTVRGLAPLLEGQRITNLRMNRPDMRRPFPENLAQMMVGAKITQLGRRAKYGLIHTDRETTMIFHLGMSGRWRIDPEEADKHDHLVIETKDHEFALCDPRRFGWVDLVQSAHLSDWPSFAGLGPEPLGDQFQAQTLERALKGRKQAIKLALLDQRIVAGLGNIYVCEALWRARIDPRKAAGQISRQTLRKLVPEIRLILEQAIADGGSTLRDFAQPDGELGYFATRFNVYGHEGEACPRCDKSGANINGVDSKAGAETNAKETQAPKIRRIAQGGRSTFYCAKCQR